MCLQFYWLVYFYYKQIIQKVIYVFQFFYLIQIVSLISNCRLYIKVFRNYTKNRLSKFLDILEFREPIISHYKRPPKREAYRKWFYIKLFNSEPEIKCGC